MERRSWSACSPPPLGGSGSCAVGPTARRSSWCIVRARSVYLAVAACAVIVYLGALWNEFVWDDQVIILGNPLVQTWAGLATAFASPYWPPFVGGYLYRPLTLLTYVLDWHIGGAAWFHAVNLLWHAGVRDRKSTRLNSSHLVISYAVFCLKKKKKTTRIFLSLP